MAELGLGVASIVDVCLRYGANLVSKYKAFKDVDNEVHERLLTIEATWSRISQQLTFVKRVWESLDAEHRDLQQRILLTFQNKLELATLQVSKIDRSILLGDDYIQSKRRAAKYALFVKKQLDSAIHDLQTWAAEFDPTWWLILRLADKTIDKTIDTELVHDSRSRRLEVARHVRGTLQIEQPSTKNPFIKEATLNSADRSVISFSTSEIIVLSSLNTPTSFILDSVDCTAVDDVSVFAKNVRDLAVRLEKIEPTNFHLLQCLGVSRTRDPSTKRVTSFNFIFRIPEGYHRPQSLRRLLLSTINPSLTSRLELAKQLATSLSYIHLLDFVHKNIRPETALVFESHDSSPFGPLFLVGFKTFRTADGKSLRLTNADRIENGLRTYINIPNDRESNPPRTTECNMTFTVWVYVSSR